MASARMASAAIGGQQASPVPADGGQPGSMRMVRAAPPWDPEYSIADVANYRKYDCWKDMLSWVNHNLKVPVRQALSAHTTTACQPGKGDGPSAASLKECGLETFLPFNGDQPSPAVGGLGGQPAVGGQMYLQIDLPHAFAYGDGFGIRYVSEPSTDKKELQKQSCLELLCYLVVSAPARVRLHPSCFKGGEQKVDEFRSKAVTLLDEIALDVRSLALQSTEFHVDYPSWQLSVATANIGNAESPPAVGGVGGTGGPAVKAAVGGHASVLRALQRLEKGRLYLTPISRMPPSIETQIDMLLPEDGLLQFLQQYPNLFEVTFTDKYNQENKPDYTREYTFRVYGDINEVLGAQTSPAVGSTSRVWPGPVPGPPITAPPSPPPPPTCPPPSGPPGSQMRWPHFATALQPAPAFGGASPAQ